MASKDKLISSAQKFLAKGQLAKAIGEYQKLVASFPKDVRNRQKLAELLSREKRVEDALNEYEQVARHYAETGFYLKAIAVYKQMQKLDPARVEIYRKLAELNEKQGLVGNALTEYRTLVAYYEQNGLQAEAVPILEKMLALDPASLNIRAKLTEIMFATQAEDKAIAFFLELVEKLQQNRGFDKIVKLYERFQEHLSDEAASRPLAEALLAHNQPEKAVQLFKKLLKAAPEDLRILRALGEGYMALEDYENARLTYRHLVRLEPDSHETWGQLARACLAAGDTDKALEALEEGRECFFEDQHLLSLQELYEDILQRYPGNSSAADALAKVRQSAGQPDATSPDAGLASGEGAVQEDGSAGEGAPGPAGAEQAAVGDGPASLLDDDRDNSATVEAPPSDAGGGFSSELDLDLDLEFSGEGVEPKAPASMQEDEPVPAGSAPPDEIGVPDLEASSPAEEDDAELEIELEIDLESLDTFGDLDAGDPGTAESRLAEATDAQDPEDSQAPAAEALASDPSAADEGDGPPLTAREAEDADAEEESRDTIEDIEPDEAVDLDEFEEVEEDRAVEAEFELEAADEAVEGETDQPEELEEVLDLDEGPDELAEIVAPADAEIVEELDEVVETEEPEVLEEAEVLEEEPASQTLGDQQPESTEAPPEGFEAELEDATFYAQQGLFDDAERVLRAAVDAYGERPALMAKLAELDDNRQASAADDDSMDFSDLISELNEEELLGAAEFLGSEGPAEAAQAEWTQELATELDSEDTESHYNLGIAYKEMGLHEDAIAEFEKASRDLSRKVDCLTLQAQCLLEMGDREKAEQTLRLALGLEGLSQDERVTLQYELGLFYRAVGRPLEALESFQGVADYDLFFRDVGEIVKGLRRELNLDDEPDDEGNSRRNRDRISFI